MSMFKCTTNKYESLYARWLKHPGDLLDFAKFDPENDILFDLCGGTGAVSIEAVKRGAGFSVLIDLNARCAYPKVLCCDGDVHNFDSYPRHVKPTLCVIRQAIGYLDIPRLAQTLQRVMPSGSRLAFNNFMFPRWKATTYKEDDDRFIEVAGHLGSHVGHIQWKLGEGFDVSFFKHHGLIPICETFLAHGFVLGDLYSCNPTVRVTLNRV